MNNHKENPLIRPGVETSARQPSRREQQALLTSITGILNYADTRVFSLIENSAPDITSHAIRFYNEAKIHPNQADPKTLTPSARKIYDAYPRQESQDQQGIPLPTQLFDFASDVIGRAYQRQKPRSER